MDLFDIGFKVDSRQVTAGSAALRTFAADAKKVENQVRESVGKINAAFKSIKPSVPLPQIRAAVRAQTAVQVRGVQDSAMARRREEVNYTAWWERQLRARERIEQAAANRSIREAERVARAQQRAAAAAARAARPAVAGGRVHTGAGNFAGANVAELGILRARNILIGAGIFQTIQLGRASLEASDRVAKLNARMRMVTTSSEEMAHVQRRLTDIARSNAAGISETTDLYLKLANSIKRMGGITENALGVTSAFAAALRAGGANTRESSAAIIQFAQAMGSGVLRGDEFRSLAEAAPVAMEALAQGLGTTREALKSYADEGLLTADVVAKAFLKTQVALELKSRSFGKTIGGSTTQVANAFQKLIATLEQDTGLFSGIASALEGLASSMPAIAKGVSMLVSAIQALVKWALILSPLLIAIMAVMAQSATVHALGAAVYFTAIGFSGLAAAATAASVAIRAFFVSIGPIGWLVLAIGAALTAWLAWKAATEEPSSGIDEDIRKTRESIEAIKQQTREREEAAAAAKGTYDIENLVLDLYKNEPDRKKVQELIALKKAQQELNEASAERLKIERESESQKKASDAYADGMRELAQITLEVSLLRERNDEFRAGYIAKMMMDGVSRRDAEFLATNIDKRQKEAAALALDRQETLKLAEAKRVLALVEGGMSLDAAKEQAKLEAGTSKARRIAQIEAEARVLSELAKAQDEVNRSNAEAEIELGRQREVADLMAGGTSLTDATKQVGLNSASAVEQEVAALRERNEVVGEYLAMDTTSLAEGFDRASTALFNFLDGFEQLNREQLRYNDVVKDMVEGSEERARADAVHAAMQIDNFASMAGAAKGFFKEGSKGYKALGAAEKTLRAIQIAGQLKDLLVTTFVEQSKWHLYGVTAQAAALAIPPPASFAALAAVVAILASLGIRTGGGSKGFRGNEGRGTVLGDPSAQSESLTKALDILNDTQDKSLRVSLAMLQSLYSIEAGINGVSSSIAQRSALGKGITPFTGRKFGTAEGLQFGAQTAGQVAGGQQLNAQFFGVRYDPGRFGYVRDTASLDAQLRGDLTTVVRDIISAASAAAMAFGVTGKQVTETLNNLSLALGDVDLRGLSAEEIQERLAAVFSALADNVAGALVPAIAEFQQVGEGLFETLIRVTTQTTAVTEHLQALGLVMSSDILANARSIQDLVNLSGGLDNLGESLQTFTEEFYSDAERQIMLQEQLARSFAELGVVMPTNAMEFRNLVTSLDLTDDAQRQLFASLIGLSEQTDEYFDAAEDAAQATNRLVESLRALRDEAARNAAATRPAEQQLSSLRSAFQQQATLAALGNTGAAALLPQLGKEFMQASLSFASTQAEYLRDLAYIQNAAERAAQVQERGMGFTSPTTMTMAGSAEAMNAATAPMSPGSVFAPQQFDNSGVVTELRSLREELHSGMFAVSKNTGKTADLLTRWDDGDQLRVTSDTLLEVLA